MLFILIVKIALYFMAICVIIGLPIAIRNLYLLLKAMFDD
jgi:hypothetical protein